jgi:diketogulonate reductase-like aldo/keto reductase
MHNISTPLKKLNNGNSIPVIGLGTYMMTESKATTVVYEACKKGYRHFDTAVLYQNESAVADGITRFIEEESEKTGKSFDEIRKSFFYTTKLWNSQCDGSYDKVVRAIDGCMDCIGKLKYIDLLLIHSPLMGPKHRIQTWKAMQEYGQDKLKNIGVSNFGAKHLEELLSWDGLKIKPVVNQLEISPWLMRQDLVKFCLGHDIEVEAFSPLTHGENLNNAVITQIAYKHEKTNAQILIKWSIQTGHIPLPKTGTVERLSGNLEVFDFELSEEDIKTISHPDAYQPTDWECTDCP